MAASTLNSLATSVQVLKQPSGLLNGVGDGSRQQFGPQCKQLAQLIGRWVIWLEFGGMLA
jgi:hypothetical protein